MKRRSFVAFSSLTLIAILSVFAWAQETDSPSVSPTVSPTMLEEGWPKTIEGGENSFVVHQPQIDAWDGLELEAHAALAVTEAEGESPIYGVVSFTTRTQIDKTERIVTFDRLEVTAARFPAAPDRAAGLQRQLQQHVADKVRFIGLDRAEAGLLASRAEVAGRLVPARNEPPKILFREGPTLLVTVDGKPVFRQIEKTKFERLVNTRALVLRDRKGGLHLHLMDGWVSASSLAGPWRVAKKNPRGIKKAQSRTLERQTADLMEGSAEEGASKPTLQRGPVPTVLVATELTEVVVFEGAPNYVPLSGTDLLYADNTTGNVFRSIQDQRLYVLISGRWFGAASASGPWSHVAQSELPSDFKQIPDDSPKENVKASVAGTPQAEEALIANSIPQTAEVDPRKAKFEAVYDGEPKLEPIEGTSLEYAVNSPTPIILVDGNRYYGLHDGIWFVSAAATGPWIVAPNVPAVIYTIPASSPLHHVTYVKVYQSSSEAVVIGYTPGYYGTVVSDDVVVYGTGYYHDPWVGSTWYGAPVTYGSGCGMTYTPWGGWAFTFGIGWSYGHWGSPWWGPYPSPYWGPYGYYPGYYPYYGGVAYGPGGSAAVWGPGGWAGTTGNVYHRWGSTEAVTRTSGGYNAWTGTGWRNQVGSSYNSRTGTLAAGQRAAVGNVYTGDYAYGKRGVATNTRTGTTVAGRSATVGNVNSGRQATVRQGAVTNPNTGQTTRVGSVSGDSGRVVRAGDDLYGTKDGQVYRRQSGGDWESAGRGGDWSGVSSRSTKQGLDRQRSARTQGTTRSSGVQRSRQAAGSWSGGGGRSRTPARRGGGGRRPR